MAPPRLRSARVGVRKGGLSLAVLIALGTAIAVALGWLR
jgi:hypothetical protein